MLNRYKYVILVLAVLVTAKNFAQNSISNTSSMQQTNSSNIQSQEFLFVNKAGNDRIDQYLDSAEIFSKKNPLLAIEYINKAIEQSLIKNDKNKQAKAYAVLGDIQQNMNQNDLAAQNYNNSINIYNKINQVQSSNKNNKTNLNLIYKRLATCYLNLKNYSDAITAINKSIQLTTLESELCDGKRVLADIYLQQNKVSEAQDILNTVLLSEQKSKNVEGEAKTYFILGKLSEKEGNETLAISNYEKAKELAEKNKLNGILIQINDALAALYRKKNDIANEILVRNSSVTLNNTNMDNLNNAVQKMEIGNAYLNNNQIQMAENFFTWSATDANVCSGTITAIGNTVNAGTYTWSVVLEGNAESYKKLAFEYLKLGDKNKAKQYFTKYANLQDSIKNVKQREIDEAIKLSAKMGENQQRMNLLEKERELNAKSIEILEKDKVLKDGEIGFRNIIIISLVIAMCVMGFAVFMIMKSSREKKKANQLLALKSLRGQMNPHFIFNALNSVNHYVSQNDERLANRYLSDFSKLMRLVMDSSKHDYIELNDEIETLKLYLQLEHSRFSDKFDYTCTVADELKNSDFEVPPMLIQPYIENAVWHGLRYMNSKGKLDLNFVIYEGNLKVIIKDNGIGRKKSGELKTANQLKQNSLGMQNIESRIKVMNELFKTNIQVSISDAYPNEENCGTKVELIIPPKNI